METKTVKALVCRVGAAPAVEECRDELDAWQQLVGGLMQVVHLDGGVFLICNEEGRLDGSAFNRHVPGRAPKLPEWFKPDFVIGPADRAPPGELGVHHVHGAFALVRDDAETGDFRSLSEEDVQRWTPVLTLPQPQ